MEIYENDTMQQWKDWGNRTYKNCFLHERYFDVTLLCSNSHLVTILQPLEEKQAIAKEYYRKMGLSKREMEVVAHAIAGLSNTEISEKLHIANATLRTHLNNAYRKIDDAEGTLEHLPTNRIVS
jgi:DNA-binding CsgD family transcriptional regulator